MGLGFRGLRFCGFTGSGFRASCRVAAGGDLQMGPQHAQACGGGTGICCEGTSSIKSPTTRMPFMGGGGC